MAQGTIPINCSGLGSKVILYGVSGQVIQVLGMEFRCNIITPLIIRSGTTDMTGPMYFPVGAGLSLPFNGQVHLQTNVNDDLVFHFSGFGILTGQAGGFLTYNQV